MEFFKAYDFLIILDESVKLIPKNGKLLSFIAIFSTVLYASFFFLFNYSLQSLIVDMFLPDPTSFDTPDPSSLTPKMSSNPMTAPLGHLGQDFAILLAVEIAFFLVFAIISFFSTISTILVSAISYNAKNLSLNELFCRIRTTWTRPLITSFYVSGLVIGYSFVVLFLSAPLLMYPNRATFWVAVFLGIIASIFYLNLFVSWFLAIVVSVVEESCYGLEAMGKAATLVKGKRFHGFLLNICVNLVVLIILLGYKMVLGNKGYVLFSVIVSCLAKILLDVAYTVLYFECKKHHGEEIELHGSLQYIKLPITAQLADDMP